MSKLKLMFSAELGAEGVERGKQAFFPSFVLSRTRDNIKRTEHQTKKNFPLTLNQNKNLR